MDVINREIDFRNCFIDFCEALILSENHKLGTTIGSIFESLYNGVHDVEFEEFYDDARNQIYDFMMWELFVDTMTTLFHYECYVDINELLSRQYLLITNPKSDALSPFPYYKFYSANRFIEERCKPQEREPSKTNNEWRYVNWPSQASCAHQKLNCKHGFNAISAWAHYKG